MRRIVSFEKNNKFVLVTIPSSNPLQWASTRFRAPQCNTLMGKLIVLRMGIALGPSWSAFQSTVAEATVTGYAVIFFGKARLIADFSF